MDINYRHYSSDISNPVTSKVDQSLKIEAEAPEEATSNRYTSAHRWPIFKRFGSKNKYILSLNQKAENLFFYLNEQTSMYIYRDTIYNYALEEEGFKKILGTSQEGPRYDGAIFDYSTKYEIYRRKNEYIDCFALKHAIRHGSIVYLYEREIKHHG